MPLRLGIASWTLPWSVGVAGYPQPERPLTAIGLVELASEIGATVVQIADNMPLHLMQPSELRELSAAAASRGIELQTGTRGVDPGHLLRYLDISDELGAKILRTVGHISETKPSIEQLAECLAPVLHRFEAQGVAIALENYEGHSAAEFAWLIREMNSPALGICLDTANSLGGLETTEQVVEELAPHTIVLHAKDFEIVRIDTRMGFNVVGCPAGQGRVDFDFVLDRLSRYDRDPAAILEHWPPFVDSIGKTVELERRWLAASIEFLRRKGIG
ncbi:MAG: sugar phosphate isomerase/epimerase family protein [Bryobacteraceae bacterium]|jgi:sugar phosphate isomerase/epimerase